MAYGAMTFSGLLGGIFSASHGGQLFGEREAHSSNVRSGEGGERAHSSNFGFGEKVPTLQTKIEEGATPRTLLVWRGGPTRVHSLSPLLELCWGVTLTQQSKTIQHGGDGGDEIMTTTALYVVNRKGRTCREGICVPPFCIRPLCADK